MDRSTSQSPLATASHSGRLWSFGRPSASEIRAFIAAQSRLSFSYSAVGATQSDPPSGYVIGKHRTRLGAGTAVYAAAKDALRSWSQFDLGWLKAEPADTPIKKDAVVAIVARAGGMYWLNAARIVYVIDDANQPNRFGFAYGTLPGHVASGEERFMIERDAADDSVWYDICAFSQPRHITVRLAYPLFRRSQARFGRDSTAAVLRSVRGATSTS